MVDQDSYTYELAVIFLAAQSQRDLLRKYRQVSDALVFEFDPVS
ncbi:MAG: hypothetical protein U5R31_17345 [Acidimicrobiia bacterium]|nr:hypothetical protein [Acidimicrobiia bacterium]